MRDLQAEAAAGILRAKVLGPAYQAAPVYGANGLMRFGIAPDPQGKRGDVLRCHLRHDDPDSDRPGAKRVWAVETPDKALLGPFSVALSFLVTNFGQARDDQCIFAIGSDAISMNVQGRADASGKVTQWVRLFLDSQDRQVLWEAPLYGAWVNLRIDGCIGAAGFVKVRRDGVMVADYAGPVGGAASTGVIRLGIYHWPENNNTWDMASPDRVVWFDHPRAL